MNIYKELSIPVSDQAKKEMLIAQLMQLGYEGFEEERMHLKAFIPARQFQEESVDALLQPAYPDYTVINIEDRNWNAEWESNFQPVLVDQFCAIRADFHPPVPGIEYDIVITPKMSFGTGHHATTYLMIQAMKALPIRNKPVFDYGTGTGVLAILAEKMGANSVAAIDNDDWSIENAIENINRNNCSKILIIKSEEIIECEGYDIILANINRNVILQNLGQMKQHLLPDGVLLLSGLLTGDQSIILEEATKHQLKLSERLEKDGWICLQLINV
jgi:ribosomal protein L11 methyltransferase